MKNTILLLGLITWVLFGCRKEDNPTPAETYANRLVGIWDVDTLTYSATVTVPFLGPIPISSGAPQAGRTPSGLYRIQKNTI
ncbi:MAG: hypothetical protein FJ343_01445 [Sphingomonadales bacterium]|nr:hypothetical protein [Sphingomonadales bacterium]